MKSKVTMGERNRTYHVAMHALSEEHRMTKLKQEELRQRMRDIWESCYGDLPKTKKENA